MTVEEQDRCQQRMLYEARGTPEFPVFMDPEKKAWFDATAASRQGQGRPPMVACAIRFGGPKGAKSESPPHSLKLGPLPCFVIPPKGFLTEDSDVAPP